MDGGRAYSTGIRLVGNAPVRIARDTFTDFVHRRLGTYILERRRAAPPPPRFATDKAHPTLTLAVLPDAIGGPKP
jgi:hypothetical protein